MTEKHNNPKTRHDFVYLFEVTNGNPNGDPDAANAPRMDPETNLGLMTDVSLKRKVRDFISTTQKGDGMRIFIQSQQALNTLMDETAKDAKVAKGKTEDARKAMCKAFYDIRMFGAVMSTKAEFNAGQVRGPMQLTFAKSLDRILPIDLSITRKASTTEEEFKKREQKGDEGRTMGRKSIVPYGLYLAKGHYNPYLGEQTGVTEDDLKVFWQALDKMFEFDRSAARGEMAPRGLWVFSHDTPLGNHPAHKLFELVRVTKKADVEAPRSFHDYEVSVGQPPAGVAMNELLGLESEPALTPLARA